VRPSGARRGRVVLTSAVCRECGGDNDGRGEERGAGLKLRGAGRATDGGAARRLVDAACSSAGWRVVG